MSAPEAPIPPRPGRGAGRARLAEILRVDHAGELAAVVSLDISSRKGFWVCICALG